MRRMNRSLLRRRLPVVGVKGRDAPLQLLSRGSGLKFRQAAASGALLATPVPVFSGMVIAQKKPELPEELRSAGVLAGRAAPAGPSLACCMGLHLSGILINHDRA